MEIVSEFDQEKMKVKRLERYKPLKFTLWLIKGLYDVEKGLEVLIGF